jgi:hypothetical protein
MDRGACTDSAAAPASQLTRASTRGLRMAHRRRRSSTTSLLRPSSHLRVFAWWHGPSPQPGAGPRPGHAEPAPRPATGKSSRRDSSALSRSSATGGSNGPAGATHVIALLDEQASHAVDTYDYSRPRPRGTPSTWQTTRGRGAPARQARATTSIPFRLHLSSTWRDGRHQPRRASAADQ